MPLDESHDDREYVSLEDKPKNEVLSFEHRLKYCLYHSEDDGEKELLEHLLDAYRRLVLPRIDIEPVIKLLNAAKERDLQGFSYSFNDGRIEGLTTAIAILRGWRDTLDQGK